MPIGWLDAAQASVFRCVMIREIICTFFVLRRCLVRHGVRSDGRQAVQLPHVEAVEARQTPTVS